MKIGEFNTLTVLRFTSVGAYLGDDNDNDVLLPTKYIDKNLEIGDTIHVFLYRDSEDRTVATTEIPYIEMNKFAYLKVTSVNFYGAFADWGLEKELMIPYKEQTKIPEEGKYYLVYLGLDEKTDRVYGSMKTNRFLEKCMDKDLENKRVGLLICDRTDLGVKVIVNDKYQGLIFNNFITENIKRGQRTVGYVEKVREDGKLDIRLSKVGKEKTEDATERILEILRSEGMLKLTDKSRPDDIRKQLQMSKRTFKETIGKLYKKRLIRLDDDKIVYLQKN